MKTSTKGKTDTEDRSNANNLSKSTSAPAHSAARSPGGAAQMMMQEIANNSQRASQLKSLQDMADSSRAPVQKQVVQLNGDPPPPPQTGSLRPALGQGLMQNLFSPNWFAKGVFKTMNFAMYMEGQPLTEEHNQVLHESLITNKKGVLDTLIAENPHVMKSQGNTPIYLLGKTMVHRPLEFYLKHRKD
jgi:hypothetical protein